jgi:3D (Asp-Asp-Asp) domain-containing protein
MRKTALIVISVLILICSSTSQNVNKNTNNINHINKHIRGDVNVLKEFRKQYILVKPIHPEESMNSNTFLVTAYDLSFQSTGKTKSHPAYGISRSGVNLRGLNWKSAKAISADPNVIPLGSRVLIEFIDDNYQKYNAVYLNVDTGNGVKNYHIDFFMGDFQSYKPNKETNNFGVTRAKVTILEN